MVKLKKKSQKRVSKNEKTWTSSEIYEKNDEYVISYVCEDVCVKVASVKSVKKCSPGEGRGRDGDAP